MSEFLTAQGGLAVKDGTESKLKFKKLKRRLGLTDWQVSGILESLWRATRQNAPEGDIGRFGNDDIAALIEWQDDADDLVRALVECGWLDEDDEFRLIVHDWSEHVPQYLKGSFARYEKEFADCLAKQRPKQPAKQHAKQPAQEPAKDHASRARPLPNQTKPNQTNSNQACAPTQLSWSVQEGWQNVDEETIRLWAEAYPAVDVRLQLKQMDLWLRSNPQKARRSRWLRFCTNWLCRRQDRGGDVPSNGTKAVKRPKTKEETAKAEAELQRYLIIKQARAAKKSDEQISEILASKGLDWG